MAGQATSRTNKSIGLYILAGVLLIFLFGLFILPTLISTDWAGNKAKEAINARLPGDIDFENISFTWFKGIHVQGITYENSAKGIVVKVADVTTSKGLLAIATNYKEFGAVTMKDPVAYVSVGGSPPPAETDPGAPSEKHESAPAEKTPQEGGNQKADKEAENKGAMAFPPIEGQLFITGGAVIAVFPDTKEKSLLQDLELQLKVAGLENMLNYLVAFQSGDGTGLVKGEGTVTLPAGDISRLEEIQSQAVLDIDSWEIADLLSVIAASADVPTGTGQLNGHLSVSGSTGIGLQIKGNLTAQHIYLQGGPLKSDTPSLERVDVELDVEKTGAAFTLNRLALISALATGSVSGTYGTQNKTEVVSEAVIDLAQVFAQFPSTLNLKQGIKVSHGKIDVQAKITATDSATLFDGSARLDQLQGVAGKRKLSLNKAVTLVAKGDQSADGLRLENFAVQSSFLNGTGQGDMNHMQVQLAADLGAALKEVEKFIELEDWNSSGKMDLNLQVDNKTEKLRALAGDVSIKDFVLQQKDRVIVPRGSFKANLVGDLRLNQEMQPQEMVDTVLDFQSWIGSGAATLKNLVLASDQTSAQVKDLGFKGSFDLGHVTVLLQTLDILTKDTSLAGKTDIDTRLSLKDDRLELGASSMETRDFIFQKANQKFSEKTIHLTTRGTADMKEQTVTLKPVDVVTSVGHMVFPELVVTNWNQIENGIKTNGSINLDLGLLATLLADILQLPQETSVAGQAVIKLTMDLTDAQQQVVQLDGAIGPVKISSKDKVLVSEDSIALILNLKGDIGDQNVTLSKVELSTPPVVLSASGNVAKDKKEHLLNTEGSISLDLKAVSGYLKSLADLEIEMAGATKQPFIFNVQSVNGQWVELAKNAELSTSFHAEVIRGFGLHIESLDVPIRLADSLGEVDIQATVNRGKMAFKPVIDFRASPAVISIPENSSILTGVGLTEDMSNDLLAKVHPIFSGAAVSQGTVDLTMQTFSWPVDAEARKEAAFAGSLTYHDVKLQAGGLLAPLLAIMKVDEREITLAEQSMEFVGENDRVHCSPLEININEHFLMLSGSIGFDQSLDYSAQVPVTQRMVGGDVYKYLEGTTITVPIGGTVSRPSVRSDVVQTALADLIKQAGTKQITNQAGKLLQKLFN